MPQPDYNHDRFALYTASVQGVESDIAFFQRIMRHLSGRPLRLVREDFCGTAALACDWVRRHPDHRAWGVDLDAATLDWGRKHRIARLGRAAERIRLVRDDVLSVALPAVDLIAALNFSYWVFKDRAIMRRYFEHARSGLKPGGLLALDAFGGSESMMTLEEKRRVTDELAPDGSRLRSFTYVWDQAHFNPVTHDMQCYISFRLADGRTMHRAFGYDWRFWTLPELRELLLEAGFRTAEVYVEGWDQRAGDTDGVYRRRRDFEHEAGWIAYIVAQR